MKDARQRGLYEYTMLLTTPRARPLHVPYRLLAQLASVAPAGAVEEFVLKRLASYGMVTGNPAELSIRIAWASRWGAREGKQTLPAPELGPSAMKAVREFAAAILSMGDAEGVQNAAFEAAKKNGLKPGEFFPSIYAILLGSDRGPRLGPYVIDVGREAVSRSLLEAVAG